MHSGKICCLVDFENEKKRIYSESYENLIAQIKDKFQISVNSSLLIKDEYEYEMDADAYYGSAIEANTKLKLTVTKVKNKKDSLDYIIFSISNEKIVNISFEPNSYLSEVSSLILKQMNLDEQLFVCFFYDINGQPLAPDYETSQYLRIRDVLKSKDKVYVLVGKNNYKDVIINKPSYERNSEISAKLYNSNERIRLKINRNEDYEKELQILIGLQIGYPSKSIIIKHNSSENLLESSEIEYDIYESYIKHLDFTKWNLYTAQTENGLRLYRNFMHCLPYSFYQDNLKTKFIAVIRYMIPFNPLLNSLYILLNKITLTESEFIALDEGIFMLFTLIKDKFNLNIEDQNIFEHTLEFFAFLLEFNEIMNFDKDLQEIFDLKLIANPFKVRNPVLVKFHDRDPEIYDNSTIKDMKKAGRDFINVDGSIDHLSVDIELQILVKRTAGINRAEMFIMKTEFDRGFDKNNFFQSGPKVLVYSDFEILKNKRDITMITSYLDLKTKNKWRTLTYNYKKNICVNIGLRECSSEFELKDIYSNESSFANVTRLAGVFNEIQSTNKKAHNEISKVPNLQEENYSRIPDEGICILIDTSISMSSPFLCTNKNRITVAKDFFNSFVNKSIGYNLTQVISLKTFDTRVEKITDFTENVYKFCEYLEKVVCNGATSLYDAIQIAIQDLKAIKVKYNKIKTRIICLSDGEDNFSYYSPIKLLSDLVENNIILDCII